VLFTQHSGANNEAFRRHPTSLSYRCQLT